MFARHVYPPPTLPDPLRFVSAYIKEAQALERKSNLFLLSFLFLSFHIPNILLLHLYSSAFFCVAWPGLALAWAMASTEIAEGCYSKLYKTYTCHISDFS